MTAAVAKVLEQAKQLSDDERAELMDELFELDELSRPATTREDIDRRLARSIEQADRGEFVDEAVVLAELREP